MKHALVIRAGTTARRAIAADGLRPEQIRIMAGAAGGPKWLALAGIDRYLFGDWFAGRKQPLYTVGSSIASWRFTAAAQTDPVAAIDRFEHVYLRQQYTAKPDRAEISRVCRDLLNELLPDSHIEQLLNHAYLRPHIIAARCIGRAAHETPRQLQTGLAQIAISNMRSRAHLSAHVERAVFHHPAGKAPFLPFRDSFRTHEIPLSAANLKPALRASASIPLMMEGEADIPGAPPGMYRDGGLIDYHMDLDFGLDEGLVLFPHFSTRIVPGWLDKFLPWRKPHAHHLDRVILIAPSAEMLARLPNGKIPDRKDFSRYKGDLARLLADWAVATRECRRMADELAELLSRGTLLERLEAFPDDSLRA